MQWSPLHQGVGPFTHHLLLVDSHDDHAPVEIVWTTLGM